MSYGQNPYGYQPQGGNPLGYSHQPAYYSGSYAKPPGGPKERALDKLRPLAICLMVVGGLGALGALGHLVYAVINTSLALPGIRIENEAQAIGVGVGVLVALGFDVLLIALNGVVIYGAAEMLKLRKWNNAMAACVISVIPCASACCVLGIPFGIWGLVVLNQPDVKQVFRP